MIVARASVKCVVACSAVYRRVFAAARHKIIFVACVYCKARGTRGGYRVGVLATRKNLARVGAFRYRELVLIRILQSWLLSELQHHFSESSVSKQLPLMQVLELKFFRRNISSFDYR